MIGLNIIGVVLILGIAYWFWIAKAKTTETLSSGVVNILVKDGVYQPAQIKVKKGEPIILRFTREATSACAKVVIFEHFNKSIELPIQQAYEVELFPDEVGQFAFTCEMGMYKGMITVI